MTNLNLKQYLRQLALGCPPVSSPRTPLATGDIVIQQGGQPGPIAL